jgi:hypothetical protein
MHIPEFSGILSMLMLDISDMFRLRVSIPVLVYQLKPRLGAWSRLLKRCDRKLVFIGRLQVLAGLKLGRDWLTYYGLGFPPQLESCLREILWSARLEGVQVADWFEKKGCLRVYVKHVEAPIVYEEDQNTDHDEQTPDIE